MGSAELEVTILAEGYFDRAFLAGLAELLGWPAPKRSAITGMLETPDLDGRPARGGGRYYYLRETGTLRAGLLIQPCAAEMSKTEAAERIAQVLVSTANDISSKILMERPRCLFWCVDADTEAGASLDPKLKAETDRIRSRLEQEGIKCAAHEGWLRIADARAFARPLIWACSDDASQPGVPDKQTLERLVCSALAARYPARAKHVQEWLYGRPVEDDLPGLIPKSYCWSHMAGWAADFGTEGFLKSGIWRPDLNEELHERVRQCCGGEELLSLLTTDGLPDWLAV